MIALTSQTLAAEYKSDHTIFCDGYYAIDKAFKLLEETSGEERKAAFEAIGCINLIDGLKIVSLDDSGDAVVNVMVFAPESGKPVMGYVSRFNVTKVSD